jgi:hypothetical protein
LVPIAGECDGQGRVHKPPELFGQALEKAIADLIERKYAAPKGSAAYRLAVRELAGLRYSREMAGPIMEDLDPWGWGAVTPNQSVEGPGPVLPLQRPPRCTQGWFA